MVTKTFDDIFEAQEANHMFLRAQRVLASERAPLAPAPLNLLGVPYFGFSLVRDLLQYCGCLSAGGSRKRSSFGDAGGSKGGKDGDVTNSKWWREWKRKQRNNASSDVYTFVARHDDMVVEGGRWRSRLAQVTGHHHYLLLHHHHHLHLTSSTIPSRSISSATSPNWRMKRT